MIVKTESKEYKIEFINTNNYKQISDLILENVNFTQAVIITESNIPNEYSDLLAKELRSRGVSVEIIKLESKGETNKSFKILENLLSQIFTITKPTRKMKIIAIGGGVIGDLAGFAASILMRGVGFIQIPTTLLAMTDSSIGGKTGINAFDLKNVIGSFYQPDFVLINSYFLQTLNYNEYISGYTEIIKHAIIDNSDKLFELLIQNSDKIRSRNSEFMSMILHKSCAVKSRIVEQDEFETKGIRATLNFGHTIAHAIEKLPELNEKILHGTAVGLGMIYELKIAEKLSILETQEIIEKLEMSFQSLEIPTKISQLININNSEKLIDLMIEKMLVDKKNIHSIGESEISFSLLVELGMMKNISIPRSQCVQLLGEIIS